MTFRVPVGQSNGNVLINNENICVIGNPWAPGNQGSEYFVPVSFTLQKGDKISFSNQLAGKINAYMIIIRS